ncbi:hypothetical protein Bca4012_092433 [Brassica carinata]|uniref:BnaC08g08580D protein n=4 Tax=Brassica TaxID=3705 RepID=A0A078G274_BRANA|nr:hypothetical protein Bca52824_074826 [Brassica carinata]KAH0862555.1 hypothetical protein HID58_079766 [Brassica napus]CAF2106819.1 unnamed protein product [Brassica napus]CDY18758.1 BnaC08g08580D [Brassica napus]VDD54426.1 unnamed protein product [Brassica oleracea]
MTTGYSDRRRRRAHLFFVNPKLEKIEIHGYKLKETEILDKKIDRDPWLHPSSADKLQSAAISSVPPQSFFFSTISNLLNDFRSPPQPYHHRDLLPRSFALIELLPWRTETRA